MSFGWGGKSKSERARSGQFASKSQVAKQRSAFLAPVQRWEKVWVTPDTASSHPSTGNATASSANGYRVKKWVPVSSLSNDQTAEDQQEAALNAAQSSDLNDLAGLQLPGQQQPHQNPSLQPTAEASARTSQSQTPVPQPSTKQPTPAPAEPTPVKTEELQPQPEQPTEPQSVQEAKEQQESQPQEDTEMGDVTAPVEAAPEAPAPVETETQAEAHSVQPEGKADEPEKSEQLDDVAEAERRKAVTNPLDEGALAESQADLHQPPPA